MTGKIEEEKRGKKKYRHRIECVWVHWELNPRLLDSRGIEPRTTPMLREYYTTKPQAHLLCCLTSTTH
jgi:hypothetical protein